MQNLSALPASCPQGLVFYAHNSAATNAAIAALLWRVVSPDALDLEPMLYQVGGSGCSRGQHTALP